MPSAREVIPEAERPDFFFPVPGNPDYDLKQTHAEWEKYHYALGQELAKRIRREA